MCKLLFVLIFLPIAAYYLVVFCCVLAWYGLADLWARIRGR